MGCRGSRWSELGAEGVGLVIVVTVVRGWDWGSLLTIVIGRLGVGIVGGETPTHRQEHG